MGWVIKEWSTDGLERLLNERTLESVRVTRLTAERDARRAQRMADRAMAEAEARLDGLEALGRELQLVVRTRRTALRQRGEPEPRPAPLPVPPRLPRTTRRSGTPTPDPPSAPTTPPAPLRRGGRASLRASPLSELFRPTEPRSPGP